MDIAAVESLTERRYARCIAYLGGRKVVLGLIVLALCTWALFVGHLTSSDYTSVVMVELAAFHAANVATKHAANVATRTPNPEET